MTAFGRAAEGDAIMASPLAIVQRLFEVPGRPPSAPTALVSGAAACHRHLLLRIAARQPHGGLGEAFDALLATLAEVTTPDRLWPIFNHPLLVDALHAMASEDRALRAWDDATAPPEPGGLAVGLAEHGRAKLNSVAWPF